MTVKYINRHKKRVMSEDGIFIAEIENRCFATTTTLGRDEFVSPAVAARLASTRANRYPEFRNAAGRKDSIRSFDSNRTIGHEFAREMTSSGSLSFSKARR